MKPMFRLCIPRNNYAVGHTIPSPSGVQARPKQPDLQSPSAVRIEVTVSTPQGGFADASLFAKGLDPERP